MTRACAERSRELLVDGRRIAAMEHDAGGDRTVVFCHGFRGEKTGPNRTFVLAARRLAERGVSSLRFDQYGSGDSDGEFVESRFDDWVRTIDALARQRWAAGRRVALWGQSMGASAAICAAADLPVSAVVAWVPDASTDEFRPGPAGWVEEGGQRVANAYWEQAHAAAVPERFRRVSAPCHLVFGTADDYVSAADRAALVDLAKPADRVDVFEGWPHSAWTAAQADEVIGLSVEFLVAALRPAPR